MSKPPGMTDEVHATDEAQRWDPERYAQNARFVADLGVGVLDWLAPRPGERILDLGCGDGALTARIVESGAEVVGADSSAELASAARARGLDVRVADGRDLPFDAEFDAVFSNAALHWMPDAEAVIDGVRRALKPGGRFVAEMGGHGNVAAIQTALIAALRHRGIDGAARSPWYFPTVLAYGDKLGASGFRVGRIELFARPTLLPTGMRGWLETFANPFLKGIDGEERERLFDEVTELLSTTLRDEGGQWIADYVRLRFSAVLLKP